MMASGIYMWLFFLSCFAVQSANGDDLHQQLGKYLDNFKAEIERKYDAKLLALEEKLKHQIAELKREFVHREDAYRTVKDRPQNKQDYQMANDENISVVGDVKGKNHDEVNVTREEIQFDESLRSGETVTHYHDNRLRRQIRSNIMTVRPKVAFFSSLTSTQPNMGENQNIPFDNVLTNIGSGFNGHHGTFVAPASGTYVLFATVFGTDWGHFMVNSNVVAKFDLNAGGQCSQMVIVHMNRGDDAAIQTTKLGEYITGDRYSTLSGFLLYPYEGKA